MCDGLGYFGPSIILNKKLAFPVGKPGPRSQLRTGWMGSKIWWLGARVSLQVIAEACEVIGDWRSWKLLGDAKFKQLVNIHNAILLFGGTCETCIPANHQDLLLWISRQVSDRLSCPCGVLGAGPERMEKSSLVRVPVSGYSDCGSGCRCGDRYEHNLILGWNWEWTTRGPGWK